MLGFRERTGGCGAGRSLRLALQHKLLLLAWRFEPTPTEVHSSSAKQPGSEALAASQACGSLPESNSNHVAEALGTACAQLGAAWLPVCSARSSFLQQNAFIAPLLFHTGLVLLGLGRWYHWSHAHTSTMTPPWT